MNRQLLGLWGGILGITAVLGSIVLGPLVYLMAMLFSSELFLFIGLPAEVLVTLVMSGLAIVFSSLARLCRPMAVAGLACGVIGVLLSLLSASVVLFLLMAM